MIVVDAGTRTQLDRLVRLRGMSEADARARMAAQATRAQRRAIADIVIDNDVPPTRSNGASRRCGPTWSAARGNLARNRGRRTRR